MSAHEEAIKEFRALIEAHRHAYIDYTCETRGPESTALFADVKRIESKMLDAYRAALQGGGQ